MATRTAALGIGLLNATAGEHKEQKKKEKDKEQGNRDGNKGGEKEFD